MLDLVPDRECGNPRNSEGAFIELTNGRLVFVYSRFRGQLAEDYATSDLCIIYFNQDYQMEDWRIIIRCEDEDAINIMSTSLLRMKDGELGLFYLVRKNQSDLKMYLRRSADDGKTWGDRVLCTPGEDVFVVNNDRVTRLSNGRIIIPAAAHPVTEDGYCEFAQTSFFYSDDDGKTWEESPERITMPSYNICNSGLQEPGVVEMEPGKIMAWARTDLGRQYQSFSEDYGEHWQNCQPSSFTSPNSPLSIRKMNDEVFIAVWNPIPQYNGKIETTKIFLGGRCPLVLAVSVDGGKHFSEPLAFETDQERGYCYCAMFFTEKDLFLAYCAGGIADGSCLSRCRIRKIPMKSIVHIVQEEKNNREE